MERRVLLSELTVTNTNDSGAGSFRQAILDSNATPLESNTINFNIPGTGPFTIQPASPLPDITNQLTINGFTQPGVIGSTTMAANNAQLQVVLDGSLLSGSNGLHLVGGNCRVSGLVFSNWTRATADAGSAAIFIESSSNSIRGCFFGIDATGLISAANSYSVVIRAGMGFAATGNSIGANPPSDSNVFANGQLSGGAAIVISGGNSTVVSHNFVGTDKSGTKTLGSSGAASDGILITGGAFKNNLSGNTIDATHGDGVKVDDASHDNFIAGNFIGTDAGGTLGILDGAGLAGIKLVNGTGNLISHNLVGGYNGGGIFIGSSGFSSDFNSVTNNYIGTTPGGSINLGNGGLGIDILNGNGNIIGGPGSGNIIKFNTGAGVGVENGTGNTIQDNSIDQNGDLPIKLSGDGNNHASAPSFAPSIAAAISMAEGTQIQGEARDGPSNGLITIETFAFKRSFSVSKEPIGTFSVQLDASGSANFNFTLPFPISAGTTVTATATDAAGNTSQEGTSCTSSGTGTPVFLNGTVLTIIGTPGPDRINVQPLTNGSVLVSDLGVYNIASATSVSITGGDAADQVVINANVNLPAVIAAGAGDDTVQCGGGPCTVRCGAGDDYCAGSPLNDEIHGGAGDDTCLGGAGDDSIFCGSGADSCSGDAGNDQCHGGKGADTVDGAGGNDFCDGGPGADVCHGGAGADTCTGGAGNDSVDGGDGDDLLYGDDTSGGGNGEDSVTGGAGEDSITGGGGSGNTLKGGPGNDTILGGSPPDTLSMNDLIAGGAGNDSITGSKPHSTLKGGPGNDTLIPIPNTSPDTIVPWASTLLGGAGNDSLTGRHGGNELVGGAGDDTLVSIDGQDIMYAEQLEGLESLPPSDTLDSDSIFARDSAPDTIYADGDRDTVQADPTDKVIDIGPLIGK
jgi:Ca2+-binding RTX toxin-like protein